MSGMNATCTGGADSAGGGVVWPGLEPEGGSGKKPAFWLSLPPQADSSSTAAATAIVEVARAVRGREKIMKKDPRKR